MNQVDKPLTSTPTDNLVPMKAIDRWAVGEQEWDPKAEKYVKRAYCPKTGELLKSNEPEKWTCPYEEALRVKEENGLEYLVFLLTEDDPYHCTDLDRIGSVDDPGVQQIIREQDTYAELSLNGKGLHLYGIATKPENQRKKDFPVNGVETESYDRMRYVVVTGKVIHDVPIRDVQGWVEENVPMKSTSDKRLDPSPVDASDEEIVEKALSSKSGERFRKLFCEGVVSIYDGDDSRADLALCGMLAYWTGCDKKRMDKIFRSSALYREKWNREDYSKNTVQTAIDNCASIYDPDKYEADKEDVLRDLRTQSGFGFAPSARTVCL